jgi:NADH dehydrogenase
MLQRHAILYQPAKTAMQSGMARTQQWILEFVPTDRKTVDPIMGWISSRDTTRQLQLTFDTAEDAQRYATEHQILVTLRQPHNRKPKPKAYANNFSTARRQYTDIVPKLTTASS